MIEIRDKADCCGCSACEQACPVKCISLVKDESGLHYAVADASRCIDCGLCERVCPVINQNSSEKPLAAYAAVNRDAEIQIASSSGGVFTALAREIISCGGTVFGAALTPSMDVAHMAVSDEAGIEALRGSKYLQSDMTDCFSRATELLRLGREVLFSGTPCQIAGLLKLVKPAQRERLITVELSCHGVPPAKIWHDYLESLKQGDERLKIVSVNFRDKRLGWDKFGISVEASETGKAIREISYVPVTDDLFMQGYVKNLYLRPSCRRCPARSGKSGADLLLADFWGIKSVCRPMYDSLGVTLVVVRSDRGQRLLDACHGLKTEPVDYEKAIAGNPSIVKDAPEPLQSKEFAERYPREGFAALRDILKEMREPLHRRVAEKLKRGVARLIGEKLISKIKNLTT